MAYRIACDECDAEIDAGTGMPGGVARRRAYCDRCAAVAAQVEEIIRKKGTEWAIKAHNDLDAERKRLMREMLPPKGAGDPREGVHSLPPIMVPA